MRQAMVTPTARSSNIQMAEINPINRNVSGDEGLMRHHRNGFSNNTQQISHSQPLPNSSQHAMEDTSDISNDSEDESDIEIIDEDPGDEEYSSEEDMSLQSKPNMLARSNMGPHQVYSNA